MGQCLRLRLFVDEGRGHFRTAGRLLLLHPNHLQIRAVQRVRPLHGTQLPGVRYNWDKFFELANHNIQMLNVTLKVVMPMISTLFPFKNESYHMVLCSGQS